jgi:hypothetical protein
MAVSNMRDGRENPVIAEKYLDEIISSQSILLKKTSVYHFLRASARFSQKKIFLAM